MNRWTQLTLTRRVLAVAADRVEVACRNALVGAVKLPRIRTLTAYSCNFLALIREQRPDRASQPASRGTPESGAG
jgi:hypothetical protein